MNFSKFYRWTRCSMLSTILVKNAYVFEHVFLYAILFVKNAFSRLFYWTYLSNEDVIAKIYFHILIAIVKEGLFWEDCRLMLFLLYFFLFLWNFTIPRIKTRLQKKQNGESFYFLWKSIVHDEYLHSLNF